MRDGGNIDVGEGSDVEVAGSDSVGASVEATGARETSPSSKDSGMTSFRTTIAKAMATRQLRASKSKTMVAHCCDEIRLIPTSAFYAEVTGRPATG